MHFYFNTYRLDIQMDVAPAVSSCQQAQALIDDARDDRLEHKPLSTASIASNLSSQPLQKRKSGQTEALTTRTRAHPITDTVLSFRDSSSHFPAQCLMKHKKPGAHINDTSQITTHHDLLHDVDGIVILQEPQSQSVPATAPTGAQRVPASAANPPQRNRSTSQCYSTANLPEQ